MARGGEEITVIYPGRINDGRGGDFCDAVIGVAGRTVTGDVELHVRSGDWRGHGHDRDPSYNRVVLHVVYARSAGVVARREDGRELPELDLEHNIGLADDRGNNREYVGSLGGVRQCAKETQGKTKAALMAAIERAGDERFSDKTGRFGVGLEGGEAGQVLYEGIMTALGYSKNKAAFLELARRVPVAALGALMRGDEADGECGTRIESLLREGMGVAHWEWFRARPSNSPESRMAAMSSLLVRYRREGLLSGMVAAVRKAAAERDPRCLESALLSTPGTSEGAGRAAGKVWALGRERAADICVNVLLPFVCALGQGRREPGLRVDAVRLYQCWPRSGSNCVERHMMAQMGLSRRMVDSARRQQGLMEIYATRCVRGQCANCGLGQSETGHDVKIKASPVSRHEPEVAGGGDHGGVVGAEADGRNKDGNGG
jgi:hypothetical protein